MPTIELLPSTSVDKNGMNQKPQDASDLDGYKEISIYVNVEKVTNTGSETLVIDLKHATRNRDADYTSLVTWSTTTSTTFSSFTYKAQFARFLRVKVGWGSATGDETADVEVLGVPKR